MARLSVEAPIKDGRPGVLCFDHEKAYAALHLTIPMVEAAITRPAFALHHAHDNAACPTRVRLGATASARDAVSIVLRVAIT